MEMSNGSLFTPSSDQLFTCGGTGGSEPLEENDYEKLGCRTRRHRVMALEPPHAPFCHLHAQTEIRVKEAILE